MERRRASTPSSRSARTCCARRSGTCSARSLRFNRVATALARDTSARPGRARRLGRRLPRRSIASRQGFRDWYFLPMIGCIWSCPTEQMLRFPVATLIRFCHNHGLLQVTGRPQWLHGARRLALLRREDRRSARRRAPGHAGRRRPAAGRRRRRRHDRRRHRALRRRRPGLPQRPVAGPAGRRDRRRARGARRDPLPAQPRHPPHRHEPAAAQAPRLGGMELRARATTATTTRRRSACTTSSTGCSRCRSPRR